MVFPISMYYTTNLIFHLNKKNRHPSHPDESRLVKAACRASAKKRGGIMDSPVNMVVET